MSTTRSALRLSAAHFGRRARRFVSDGEPLVVARRGDDIRLFALTFLGGFLFTSVYLS